MTNAKEWLRPTKLAGVIVLAGLLTACATQPDEQLAEGEYVEDVNDPAEDFNRFVFEVNMGMDKILLRPVAEIYNAALPDVVQDSVRSFLDNLRTPVILINDLLQGEFSRAWDTVARFGINTFVGGLGFVDLAEGWGFEKHSEDFGQTLGTWGMGEGPYMMLPLFGPSNARDSVGRVVDYFLDPLNWILPGQSWAGVEGVPGGATANFSRSLTDGIDMRARNLDTLDAIEENSLDFYATIRSLYRQKRRDEINNGAPEGGDEVPSASQSS